MSNKANTGDTLMQKTEREQWEEIGEQLSEFNERWHEILEIIHTEGNVPKSARDKRVDSAERKISDGLTQLRSELEERMVTEHPELLEEQDFTEVFYAND